MTIEDVVAMASRALYMVIKLSAPILLISLVVLAMEFCLANTRRSLKKKYK